MENNVVIDIARFYHLQKGVIVTRFFLCLFILSLFAHLKLSSQNCVSESNVYKFTFAGKDYEVVKQVKSWTSAASCAAHAFDLSCHCLPVCAAGPSARGGCSSPGTWAGDAPAGDRPGRNARPAPVARSRHRPRTPRAPPGCAAASRALRV